MNKSNKFGVSLILGFLFLASAPELDVLIDALPIFLSRTFGEGVRRGGALIPIERESLSSPKNCASNRLGNLLSSTSGEGGRSCGALISIERKSLSSPRNCASNRIENPYEDAIENMKAEDRAQKVNQQNPPEVLHFSFGDSCASLIQQASEQGEFHQLQKYSANIANASLISINESYYGMP